MIKLRIETHEGKEFFEEVESYDAQALSDRINDEQKLTIAIGNRILSRIKIADISIAEFSQDMPEQPDMPEPPAEEFEEGPQESDE